ncbi:Lsr2 family protein [Dactylosporangium sp. NPDC005572]|uniref:histone-like nucleoid-structuring protein Lsr2 n=1 Tax=Dactylosporangium sp. NPDC005572 TaxID=3156889 RepID=UPI0033AEEC6B
MAKLVRTIVTDDLDASTDSVGTYRFALDGVDYEIDLSEGNLGRLRAALAPFIAAGRRLPKQQRTATRGHAAAGGSTAADAATVRTWWAANAGRADLPAFHDRGAIPRRVRLAHAAERHANP